MKKVVTLCLVKDDTQVLLGMKKRGFGAGYYNGFGGKVEPHETIEAAAIRELSEEAGITAEGVNRVGVLLFTFRDEPALELEMHIFKVDSYMGEIVESDEMKPQWFNIADIPYNHMWTSDVAWFPLFLSGKKFTGSFHFDSPASREHVAVILEQTLTPVEEF